MSRILTTACLVGVLVMANANLRAGASQPSLRVGDPLPELKGQTLTGRTAVLPQSSGKVTLVAMGFTYKSRFPVEAWAEWYRATVGWTDVNFFEVPMIGGAATLGRWFINRGMRNGTPAELHDQVITVYGGTGDWKQRLSYSSEHKDDAYLIVIDREGRAVALSRCVRPAAGRRIEGAPRSPTDVRRWLVQSPLIGASNRDVARAGDGEAHRPLPGALHGGTRRLPRNGSRGRPGSRRATC
jgi:hypothetical protein